MKTETTPRVIIDARMVRKVPHGVARYVTQIAKGLRECHLITPLSYKPLFLISPEMKDQNAFSEFETIETDIPFLSPWEIIKIPKLLKKFNSDLYHSPSFSSILNCPCKSIVTIHDLNHLNYGNLPKKLYYHFILRKFALNSETIITVSEFSRRELANWLKISPQKIQIVYNAIDSQFFKPKNSKATESLDQEAETQFLKNLGLVSGKYFFCLSNAKPHKNLELLTKAYQNFSEQHSMKWPLVITVHPFSKINGIKEVGGLQEKEAKILLQNAGGMFFPSLYEGFGLPPVEAAVAGVPLAISKIPPHEEGLQDLGTNEVLWVSPRNLEGWSNAFFQIYQGKVQAPKIANRRRILERFSTTQLGERMNQIYQSILEGKFK